MLKTPLPEKQGLKHRMNRIFWQKYWTLKTPLPEKQGLKLKKILIWKYRMANLKPHFQKNKDWNIQVREQFPLTIQLKTPLPEKQGLKSLYNDENF